MRILAAILASALGIEPAVPSDGLAIDGGTTAETVDGGRPDPKLPTPTAAGNLDDLEDAGVYQVTQAQASGHRILGEGWWLSQERMERTGAFVVKLQNENSALVNQSKQAQEVSSKQSGGALNALLVGAGLGLIIGGGTVFWFTRGRR